MLRLNKVGGEEREALFSFCLSLSLSLYFKLYSYGRKGKGI
jgi:hypothetical protein